MAQQTASSVAALRAASYRISSAPPEQLPKVASQVAATLWNCKLLLSAPQDTKQANDASTALHRFKTQLSTLLQDRTVEGRWSAVVLVKAAVEASGLEVLGKSNAWVRNLLGILKKPDPTTTHNLAVLTLTRIFMLTWDYSNLVREITTPALTTFVPMCISNIENKRCSASELSTVLEAFATLVPRHPTIFRTHETRLRAYLGKIMSSHALGVNGNQHYTQAHQTSARRLWVLLCNCAPKQGGAEAWNASLRSTVAAAHSTCDRIFRAVKEDWKSIAGVEPSAPGHVLIQGDPAIDSAEAGLLPWSGIHAGGERLVTLLCLLNSHVECTTPHAAFVRLGLIADLLTRVFDIVVPAANKQNTSNFNNQISRDEREALFSALPAIHIAAAQVSMALIDRITAQANVFAQILTEQALSVFKNEHTIPDVRLWFYRLLSKILDLMGPSMLRSEALELEPVLKACCTDILPHDKAVNTAQASKTIVPANGIKQQLGLTDSTNTSSHPVEFRGLSEAAASLLRTALTRLDALCISPKLRAQIDRIAILLNDEDIVYASVMNPPRKPNDGHHQASLLPMLARQFNSSQKVEALLRPRMPTIWTSRQSRALEQQPEIDDEDEEEEDDEEQEVLMQASDEVEIGAKDPSFEAADMSAVQLAGELDESNNLRKRAFEEAEEEVNAKRLRASPIAKALLPNAHQSLPGPEAAQSSTSVQDSRGAFADSQLITAIQTKSLAPTTAVSEAQSAAVGLEDDDSDFELPPLTMEPDTDPEDDDDEE